MNVVGMIVEYNPFHNGHLWHVNEARRLAGADCAIGIMSGNFLQRGEPAIADKWSRAAMAVKAGVDLVIELPAVFAVRSAQYFAAGGIRLLSRLGVVSHVCFGTEVPDLSRLANAASALADETVIAALHNEMKTGQTYAASLTTALATTGIDASLLQNPNNLLAIEYLRAIAAHAPQLKPLAIQRIGANYHDNVVTSAIASATAIRAALSADDGAVWQALPAVCAEQLAQLIALGKAPVILPAFDTIVLSKLRAMNHDELAALPEIGEGLHNKISHAALQATTCQELLFYTKSKRYTLTRLQRILMYALLGITKAKLQHFDQSGPLYARVLAFNTNGRTLLKAINCHATIPVITKTAQFLTSKQRQQAELSPAQAMLAYDIAATDMYSLGFPNCRWRSGGQDYQISPCYLPS